MIATLLLRCSGPMQSWGTQSRFTMRDTGREPSKSGVIGLLCAALGRPRWEPLGDLATLRMGVRVDREGRLERDYHTAGKDGYYRIGGGLEQKNVVVSTRYYLADACFLVGLEGEDLVLLRMLYDALQNPVWALYLGRKAFVPGEPVWLPDGLLEGWNLEEALRGYPRLCSSGSETLSEPLRAVIEDPAGSVVVNDTPVNFIQRQRSFHPRRVRVEYISVSVNGEEG